MSQHVSDEVVAKDMGEIRSGPSSRRHGDTLPHIHKVGTPPKQTLFQEIKHSVVDTFFPDKPFEQFKDQTGGRKFLLGLQSLFPLFEWGRDYNLKKFRGDFISGLTIASLCIPQVNSHFSMILLRYLFFPTKIAFRPFFSSFKWVTLQSWSYRYIIILT